MKQEKDYIDTDILGKLYKGDKEASDYCQNIIRIENYKIRAAFATLIGNGCKGSDVDKFVLQLAKEDWRFLDVVIKHKTPVSNATQLKVKLSKGFKLAIKAKPKSYSLSDEINKIT